MLFRGVISYRSLFGTAESLVTLAVVFFFCSYSGYAQAGQVSLAWGASPGAAGYQLSYGPSSGNYTGNVDAGNNNVAGTVSYTLTLQDGKYYIAAKAYNSGKTSWSGFSNEVVTTISTSSTAPTASFSATPTSGSAPLPVDFADTSTGTISTRSWNFGDGSPTSILTSGTKTYSTPGAYTMKLTVTGPGGSSIATKPITVTVAAPSGSVCGANSRLVAAYDFEEASGTTVVDGAGQGNKGTISGATRITTGRFGKALSFDGVNDWVTINDAPSLDLTACMTLEAWVYPTVDMTHQATVVLKQRPSGLVYSLRANSDADQPSMAVRIGGSYRTLNGGPWLSANQWTHLAATYDGTTERLYVNGTQRAQQPQTGPIEVSSGPLRLGGNSVWGEFFKGRIDEVRIYNRALSATEIQTDKDTSVATSSPPVILVGTKTVGSVTDSNPQGTAKAFRTTAATTGMVTSLSVYVDSGSTATKLVAGLYTDKNGHPGTLLKQGTLSSPGSGGWKKVPLPPVSINAGSNYWIALLGTGGVLRFRDAAGGTSQPSETSAQTTLSTLPGTWSTGTASSSGPLSAYGAGYK